MKKKTHILVLVCMGIYFAVYNGCAAQYGMSITESTLAFESYSFVEPETERCEVIVETVQKVSTTMSKLSEAIVPMEETTELFEKVQMEEIITEFSQESELQDITEKTTELQPQETIAETASQQGEIVYATTVVNIRNKPSTRGNVVGQTEINQEFLCLEKLDNGWYLLQVDNVEVYAYGKYFSEKPTTKKPKDNPYTYEDMVADIRRLEGKYESGFKAEILGNSYDNRDIYLLTVGNPSAERAVLFTASIHGAEYISSQLVMAQIEYYLDNLKEVYEGASFEEILNKVCIYVIPMVNPDGVAISQEGFYAIRSKELREKLFELEYTDYWSSNARGVDLNRNFPTVGFGKENGKNQNYSKPSFKYYEGEHAASEQETQLIIDFVTSKDNLCAYISYHTKGEVIYWNKGQNGELYNNTSNIVKIIAKLTGYKNVRDYQVKSGIDYEWAILEAKIPGCTVELGDMESYFPVRQSQWQDIWKRNQYVMIAVTKYAFN